MIYWSVWLGTEKNIRFFLKDLKIIYQEWFLWDIYILTVDKMDFQVYFVIILGYHSSPVLDQLRRKVGLRIWIRWTEIIYSGFYNMTDFNHLYLGHCRTRDLRQFWRTPGVVHGVRMDNGRNVQVSFFLHKISLMQIGRRISTRYTGVYVVTLVPLYLMVMLCVNWMNHRL